MRNTPTLLAIGGAHIDRRGQIAGDHVAGASNPGTMREEVGGGVFNAAAAARQMGVRALFLSVRGGDAQGEAVARAVDEAGLEDLSSTFLDRRTATYTAILDRHGDVITALADMSIYETALPRQISRRKTRDAIAESDAILADANMPADSIRRLISLAEGKPVFMIAISPAKVLRLQDNVGGLHCLFMNMREARALTGFEPEGDCSERQVFSRLAELGLKRAAVTNGPGEVLLLDGGAVSALTPPAPKQIADVTGAGDALAGVTVAMMMQGQDFNSAVRTGIAAAVANIESRSAIVNLRSNTRFSELLKIMNRQKD
jgi:sugar/nucleoside kinase (ribokinase family)